jgi:hypothetical protein
LVDFAYEIGEAFRPVVRQAFAAWEKVANIDFVEVADSLTNNIRLAWGNLDGKDGTLAEAHWQYQGQLNTEAEIVFDLAESWTPQAATATSYSFLDVAIHEIGHTLGLDHVSDPSSIMYPYANGLLTPSTSDIARIQMLYGHPKNAPGIVPSTSEGTTDVFRFYNNQTGVHFYTASANERDSVLSNLGQFSYEGRAFTVHDDAVGTQAVYRFWNTTTGTHFYTASTVERDHVQQTLSNFKFEGPAFKSYADAGSHGEHHAVYRFWNTTTGTHFYTANEGEKINVETTIPSFKYEGIAYYVD